ncbi:MULTISPECIES: hypothetical protein [Actinomycetes]|uniref:hypothetical protein n=1 Tax=Actinomycetes TaxID=1760 RepID=UPI0012DD7195|nr:MULTISPECIES: hypothetical protein [Actinomycetes]
MYYTKWAWDNAIDGAGGPATAPQERSAQSSDPSEVSAEVFADSTNFTRAQQMDYAGPELNSSVARDTQLVLDELKSSGWDDYNFFNRQIVVPNRNNSPQQIWDQITLGYSHVRNLSLTDIQEAKKIATAVAEGDAYNSLIDTLQNNDRVYTEVGLAYDEGASPMTENGQYFSIQANGTPIVAFNKKTLAIESDKRTTVRVVARFVEGNQPNSQRWVLAGVFEAGSIQ